MSTHKQILSTKDAAFSKDSRNFFEVPFWVQHVQTPLLENHKSHLSNVKKMRKLFFLQKKLDRQFV